MGLEPFRRLLNDSRFAHCAFIAETPVDEEGDERRNVETMKDLVRTPSAGSQAPATKARKSAN
jgi:deoxyribonuclease-4